MKCSWVLSAAIHGFEDLLSSLGVSAHALAVECGIPAAALQDPELPLEVTTVNDFFNLAATRSQRHNVGLLLSQYQSGAVMGPLWSLVLESKTIAEAFRKLEEFSGLYSTFMTIRLSRDDEGLAYLQYHTPEGQFTPSIQSVEAVLAIIVRELKYFTDNNFQPTLVLMQHTQPKDLTLHHQLLGARLEFNAAINAVVFEEKILNNSLPTNTPRATSILEIELSRQLPHNAEIIKSRTESLIRALLPYMPCTLIEIASKLGMSSRTLQNKLSECSTTFQQTHIKIRMALARKYLSQTHLTIASIAEGLQFSESSAFTRFFKTHQGTSPRQFRKNNSESEYIIPDRFEDR